jgi:acetyl esterase/lipase
MDIPDIKIRALGLNCGMYDLATLAAQPRKGLHADYLGKEIPADDPRFRVLEAIGPNYPPAFITTACHDFLRNAAEPMYDHLISKGIHAQWKCYGNEDDKTVGHVFHVNIPLPEAIRCNDDSAAFFRSVLD